MKIIKSLLIAALSVSMTVPVLSSCGNSNKENATSSQKLTYWSVLSAAASAQFTNFGETKIAQELEKRLGVDIEYMHPASGQQNEKFNIMIAMKDLPDIIEYNWMGYPGGADKAIDQKRIIDISKYLNYAPNFKKYLEENPDIEKLVKTDDGRIVGFPLIESDGKLGTSAGIVLRKDWLDELGLQVPETIDEWEFVLKAFKDKKKATAPLTMLPIGHLQYGAFVGAYGITADTYVDNGVVKYGPAQPEFKEFLSLMNKWYANGLIDPSIASQDRSGVDANILNGASGATVGALGSGVGKWLSAATQPGYDLVAAPYPTLKKGDKPMFGHKVQRVTPVFSCISTSCKNIELAMKYLDYGYSKEGELLYNFGIEGESYTMVDGKPKYTDVILHNPDGKSASEAMANYLRAYEGGPFIQDVEYYEQYIGLPQQQNAWDVWANTDAQKHIMPYLYYDSADDIAKSQTAVNSYYEEMLLKFILGVEPIDKFDDYVEQLNIRGLGEIIAAKQKAYEKYLQR